MTDHVQITGATPRIQYIADGTQKIFEFPFAIFESNNLKVYIGNTLQNSNSYSTTIGTNSGSITFTTAPENESVVTLCRNLTIKRTSDFQEDSALRDRR